MLGHIVSFRREIGVGIIRCENGRKYRFQRHSLVNARAELEGEEVDFLLSGVTPHAIVVLAGSPWSVFAPEAQRFETATRETAGDYAWPMAA